MAWLLLLLLGKPASSPSQEVSAPDVLRLERSKARVQAYDTQRRALGLRFIPEHRLADYENEQPLLSDRLTLRQHLERQAASQIGCQRPIEGDIPGSASSTVAPDRLVATVLRNNPVVLIGNVEKLTAGWDVARERAATLVSVKVDEVVADRKQGFRQGTHVSYLQESGSFLYAGSRLCTIDPTTAPVSVGTRVVIAGDYDTANPSNVTVTSTGIFTLQDSMVVPTRVRDGGRTIRPITLDEMHQQVKSSSADKE